MNSELAVLILFSLVVTAVLFVVFCVGASYFKVSDIWRKLGCDKDYEKAKKGED